MKIESCKMNLMGCTDNEILFIEGILKGSGLKMSGGDSLISCHNVIVCAFASSYHAWPLLDDYLSTCMHEISPHEFIAAYSSADNPHEVDINVDPELDHQHPDNRPKTKLEQAYYDKTHPKQEAKEPVVLNLVENNMSWMMCKPLL